MSDKRSRFEKRTFQLLADFAEDAKQWGYAQDQLAGTPARNAETMYEASLAAMINRINQLHACKRRCERLEEQLATLQAQFIAATTSG